MIPPENESVIGEASDQNLLCDSLSLMRNGWRRSKNEESSPRFFIAKFQLHDNLIAAAGDKQGLWRGVFGVRMGPQKCHPQSSCNHRYGDWAERSVDME
jgi:hypothetical protein